MSNDSELVPNKPLFRVREVAEVLDVNVKTVHKGLQSGEIPCLRLGRVIRIPRHVVVQLLLHGRVAE